MGVEIITRQLHLTCQKEREMKNSQRASNLEKIRLYYFPGTRASRVTWMLEESGLPYDIVLIDLREREHKSERYLAINPLGKVPALTIGERVIIESLAINLYLADYSSASLAPDITSPLRADYYQWMAFSVATLEPAIIEQERADRAYELGVEKIDMGPVLTPLKNTLEYINRTLCDRCYFLGKEFTAVDVMIGSQLHKADNTGLLAGYQHIRSWLDRVRARPAFQKSQAA